MISRNPTSIQSQALLNIIGRAISFLINILTPIILVRLLIPAQFGQYKQVIMIHQLFVTLLSFNIPGSILYFFPKASSQEGRRSVLSAITLILGIVSLSFLAISIFVHETALLSFSNLAISDFFYLIVITISMEIISGPLDTIFIAEEKAISAMNYYIFNQLWRVVLLLGAILIFHTVYSALFALMLYSISRAIFVLIYLHVKFQINIIGVRKGQLIDLFTYVMPLGISMIAGTISRHAEKLILLAYFTAADFAIYSVGNFGIPIGILYLSIGNVILPQISKSTNHSNSFRLWKKMIVANSVVTLPIVIFFIITGMHFITLIFGTEYSSSVPVFTVFIMTLPFQMLGHGYILRGLGETKHIFYARIVKMLVSLILGYFIIRQYGTIGAACTYFISFVTNVILQLHRTKRVLRIGIKEFMPWKEFGELFLISLALAIIPLAATYGIESKVLSLLISGVFYFGIYLIFVLNSRYKTLLPAWRLDSLKRK